MPVIQEIERLFAPMYICKFLNTDLLQQKNLGNIKMQLNISNQLSGVLVDDYSIYI